MLYELRESKTKEWNMSGAETWDVVHSKMFARTELLGSRFPSFHTPLSAEHNSTTSLLIYTIGRSPPEPYRVFAHLETYTRWIQIDTWRILLSRRLYESCC